MESRNRLRDRSRRKKDTKSLTAAKARLILRHGEIGGEPLTEKQRKFFGAKASAQKPHKENK